MTKKIFVILIFFRLAVVFACDLPGHFDFVVSNGEEILYQGCYDAVNLGPHTIKYILTKERAEATGVRRPSVSFTQNRDGGMLRNILQDNGYSLPRHSDYTRSGYDRGHMAPNADFNDTRENAISTFFIANIWPQTPDINRVEWYKTEKEARRLASEYLVVNVLIIVDEFNEVKMGNISIPSCFKKRIYNSSGELIYEIDVYQLVEPPEQEQEENE